MTFETIEQDPFWEVSEKLHDPQRQVRGVQIPKMTYAEVQERYGFHKNDEVFMTRRGPDSWVLPLVAEEVYPTFIVFGGHRIYSTVLNQSVKGLTGENDWFMGITRLSVSPPAALKNFLVALRTYSGSGKSIRILYRGSKAEARGARWIRTYALYLSRFDPEVLIDCYDIGEVQSVETGKGWKINHIPNYYDGDGSDYDVAIDDAYEMGYTLWEPKSSIWSRKGVGERFFHDHEKRMFSHTQDVNYASLKCKCDYCKLCFYCAPTYGDFFFLKTQLQLFGLKPCMSYEVIDDLMYKGRLLLSLSSQPTVEVVGPADHRGAIALQDEVSYDLITPTKISIGHGEETHTHIHKVGFVAEEYKSGETHFDGETVTFAGVEPSILGASTLAPDNEDRILFTTHLLHVSRFPYRRVWIPSSIPGYALTGRSLGPYKENIRIPRKDPGSCEARFSVRKGIEITVDQVEKVEYQPIQVRVPAGTGKVLSEPAVGEDFVNTDPSVTFFDGTRGPKTFDVNVLDLSYHKYVSVIQTDHSEVNMYRLGKTFNAKTKVWVIVVCGLHSCKIHHHHFERALIETKDGIMALEYHTTPSSHVQVVRKSSPPLSVSRGEGGYIHCAYREMCDESSAPQEEVGSQDPSKTSRKNKNFKKQQKWKKSKALREAGKNTPAGRDLQMDMKVSQTNSEPSQAKGVGESRIDKPYYAFESPPSPLDLKIMAYRETKGWTDRGETRLIDNHLKKAFPRPCFEDQEGLG